MHARPAKSPSDLFSVVVSVYLMYLSAFFVVYSSVFVAPSLRVYLVMYFIDEHQCFPKIRLLLSILQYKHMTVYT